MDRWLLVRYYELFQSSLFFRFQQVLCPSLCYRWTLSWWWMVTNRSSWIRWLRASASPTSTITALTVLDRAIRSTVITWLIYKLVRAWWNWATRWTWRWCRDIAAHRRRVLFLHFFFLFNNLFRLLLDRRLHQLYGHPSLHRWHWLFFLRENRLLTLLVGVRCLYVLQRIFGWYARKATLFTHWNCWRHRVFRCMRPIYILHLYAMFTSDFSNTGLGFEKRLIVSLSRACALVVNVRCRKLWHAGLIGHTFDFTIADVLDTIFYVCFGNRPYLLVVLRSELFIDLYTDVNLLMQLPPELDLFSILVKIFYSY